MSAELEEARRAEPAWDELRERRVLARVLAAREEGAGRRRRARIAVGLGAVATIAAAALLVWTRAARETEVARDRRAVEPAAVATVAPEGEAGSSRPARLALHDGSEVFLGADAEVRIASESEHAVRIEQLAGEARYVVSHRPERAFEVIADGVEVRVRGTRFVVRRFDLEVEVEVEEGRVEVARGEAVSLLGAGDSLRVRTHEPEVIEGPAEASAPAPARAPSRERRATRERGPGFEALIAQADEARRGGQLDDAAALLRAAIAADGGDPRVATAYFTLGRVERARGHAAAAAAAFEASLARAPHGALAEDALAEAAVSWASAGQSERARAAAARYLELHPAGLYADRVRHLAE